MAEEKRTHRFLFASLLALAIFLAGPATAHRSGCHAWHSCPSDHATYICGDTGHCSQCPDNQYCESGSPHLGRMDREAFGAKFSATENQHSLDAANSGSATAESKGPPAAPF